MRLVQSSRLLLLLVATLAVLFRFARNDRLQFWSDDEEIHAAVVQRMIVTKRPSLVSPQPTIGTSIGSLFHIASVPLFVIANMDPQRILSIFSITGIFTTLTMFFLGREIGGRKLGLIASFLYATSFLAGLYDRRWWPITWTPLLSAIGLLAAIRLVKTRRRRYLYMLTGITATAIHGDPAMLLFGLFTLVLLNAYRIRFPISAWIVSSTIIVVALFPLALFELRHPGTIVKPLIETFQRKQSSTVQNAQVMPAISITAETIRWLLFPKATNQLEPLLYPINATGDRLGSILQIFMVTVGTAYFVRCAYQSKKNRPGLYLLAFYLAVFFLGLFLFTTVYRHPPQRVYVTLLFPVIFVIAAWYLTRLMKRPSLLIATLFIFLTMNASALHRSRYRYPLSTRQLIVQKTIRELNGKDFSLYVTGDPYLESGGFTRLFIMSGAIPKKSFTDKTLGWWYRTHSLYLTEPTEKDQDRIVIIMPTTHGTRTTDGGNKFFEQTIDTVHLLILDNETQWFKKDYLGDPFEI